MDYISIDYIRSIDWQRRDVGMALELTTTLITHPLRYVNTLVQLGHEVTPTYLTTNFFKEEVLLHHCDIYYLIHICRKSGFFSLWRGVWPSLAERLIMTTTYRTMNDMSLIRFVDDSAGVFEEPHETVLLKKTTAKITAVIFSHPFTVVAIRCMAYFVGEEAEYATTTLCVGQIYKEGGLSGFFVGILPRLAFEIVTLWVTEMVTYYINNNVIMKIEELPADSRVRRDAVLPIKYATPFVATGVAGGFAYPFSVVTTVMICNGAHMRAGGGLLFSCYSSPFTCLYDLNRKGVLYRKADFMFSRPAMPHD